MNIPSLPNDLAAKAAAVGLRLTEVRRRTDKTLLAVGELSGEPVAAKYLLDPDPFWASKWQHELGVYQVFMTTPPPLDVPKLLYTDDARLLVLQWLDGKNLDDDRYPQRTLTSAEADAVLCCVETLNQWQPPTGTFAVAYDYEDRFRRYHALGWLTDADLAALQHLLRVAGNLDQVNHGDPIASNILLRGHHGATLLDWEFAGTFLPGFDLAMLHTQLGARTPRLKDAIDAKVAAAGQTAPFLVNLAAVLTRELRIHREMPAGPVREARLLAIESAWLQARERIHQQTGTTNADKPQTGN